MNYDIIVIGAGPAGTTFSRIASQNGLNVLIIDKRKDIGNPVRCGEGLGKREVVKQGLDLPKQVFSVEIEGAKVVAPNGKEIIWKDETTKGWVLERKMFDKWLAELAVKEGAKVLTYTRATDFIKEDGKIVGIKAQRSGKELEFRAPLIISAEGMEALMARKAGFKAVHNLYDVDTCYQYEVEPYEHQNLIELYFGNEIAPRGYVWVFPKANKKANVGIGIGAHLDNWLKGRGIKGADPKVLLDKWMEINTPDVSTLEDFGGIISVGAPLDEFVKDNIMVIGTAAKQVDPIHGGGIALAMEAGLMAANVAVEAHKKKDFSKEMLYKYEKEWRETTGKKEEMRLKLRKVMENVKDDDLNYIFDTITKEDLNDIMHNKFAKAVSKVVAGRPQLLGLLRHLI